MGGLLDKYPKFPKVAAAMKLDDLPECYPLREMVYFTECGAYDKRLELEPDIFEIQSDTRLALYRGPAAHWQKIWDKGGSGGWTSSGWEVALRVAGPYAMRHMPWYENPRWLTDGAKHVMERNNGLRGMWTKQLAQTMRPQVAQLSGQSRRLPRRLDGE